MTDVDEILARTRARRRLPKPERRRDLRERSGASQQDLAEALGVNRATICRWEGGLRTPRGAHLQAYLELLDRLEGAR